MRPWLVVALLVVIAGAGGAFFGLKWWNAQDDGSAAWAAETTLKRVNDGKYDALYESLFPRQMEQIDRDVFVKCYREQTEGFVLKKVHAVRSERQSREPVAGSVEEWTSTLVTVEFELNGRPSRDSMNMYRIGGAWRWSLTEEAFDAYADGNCR